MRRHWARSLAMSGNMAYRGTVPPSFIRRYALVNVHTAADLVDACYDGPINISLYQARQEKYEPLMRLIFDGVPLPNYQICSCSAKLSGPFGVMGQM